LFDQKKFDKVLIQFKIKNQEMKQFHLNNYLKIFLKGKIFLKDILHIYLLDLHKILVCKAMVQLSEIKCNQLDKQDNFQNQQKNKC